MSSSPLLPPYHTRCTKHCPDDEVRAVQLPYLSACIMAKNEAKVLDRCLESLRGVVDEICFLDTGSTDETLAIAERHGCEVGHFEWCDDFSAARNASLEMASGKWILVIDCDEYLAGNLTKPGELKLELVEYENRCAMEWPTLFLKVPLIDKNLDETESRSVCKQLRVFPNHPGIRYEMPIHNRLVLSQELRQRPGVSFEVEFDQLHIVHRGYDSEVIRSKGKIERAFRILTKALAERPDALNYFYLGREQVHIEDWAGAVESLTKARDLLEASGSTLDAHHKQAVYFYLVTAMSRTDAPLDAILDQADAGLRNSPLSVDLWHLAGCVLLDRGDAPRALVCFEEAVKWLPHAEANDQSFLVHRPWNLYYNLGQVEAVLHNVEKSREWFLKAVEAGDPNSDSILDLLNMKEVTGKVRAGMATIPSRVEHLRLAVASLLPQVDELVVYLNNFHEQSVPTPTFLDHEKVTVVHSTVDLRDSGKFWGLQYPDSEWDYYFSVDDDIVYPLDYVTRLVQKVEQYNRKVAVGVHGSRLIHPVKSYIQDRVVFHCLSGLAQDLEVDVLGTGTLAFHRETFPELCVGDFEKHGMADLWFSLVAREQRVERRVISRRPGWITVLELPVGTSLWDEAARDDSVQTELAQRFQPTAVV